MVRNGDIDKEQARYHPLRNVVTQALGIGSSVKPYIAFHDIERSDVLVLCSDGLSDALSDSQIRDIVLENVDDLELCADCLVKEANVAGGFDNITVVLASP